MASVSSMALLSLIASATAPPAAGACRADRIMHSLTQDREGRILVAAHRGAHDVAPENSLAAIDGAVAAGADVVELDARVTRDGVAVLMHDDEVTRTTDGAGKISEQDWARLQIFRLKRADGSISNERMPTLAEALARAKCRIVVDLDLKSTRLDPILDQVAAQGMSGGTIFYHSDPAILRRVRARFASALLLPLATSDASARDLASDFGARLVHLREGFASAALSGALDASGANGWMNALGSLDERLSTDADGVISDLSALGIDVIQTDRPAAFVEGLRRRGLRTVADLAGDEGSR